MSQEQPDQVSEQSVSGKQQSEIILYDADAEQRVFVNKEFNETLIPIAFVMGPQDDKSLKEYDRLCDRRLEEVDAEEAGEQNAMSSRDRADEAAQWLFDDRAITTEGIGEEGEELPADWKTSVVDDRDKVAVVDQGYLATGEVPKPPAKPGTRLPLNYKTAGAARTITIRAIFDGYELELSHSRSIIPSAEHLSEFKSLQTGAASVGGKRLGQRELLILAKGGRYGALYDSIGYTSKDYKGRVPLHHKRKVVELDLAGTAKVVAKKPNGSAS